MKGPPLSLSRSLLAYLPPSATSSSSPLISGPPIPFPPIALLVYLPRPSTPPTQTFPLPPPLSRAWRICGSKPMSSIRSASSSTCPRLHVLINSFRHALLQRFHAPASIRCKTHRIPSRPAWKRRAAPVRVRFQFDDSSDAVNDTPVTTLPSAARVAGRSEADNLHVWGNPAPSHGTWPPHFPDELLHALHARTLARERHRTPVYGSQFARR